MSYGVSIITRNEEENIGPLIKSLYNQTIKPQQVVVVDDGSTDTTAYHLFKLSGQYPNLYWTSIKLPRHKFKGWNISNAINISLHKLLELYDGPLIMRMDSDVKLDNPMFVESLLGEFLVTPKLGITGGVSNQGKLMHRHVTDAARIYNRECLLQLMKTYRGSYPIMYGHDSFMIHRARWLGWEVKPVDVKFTDIRPYRRSLKRWFLTGRFRYMNGFTFMHTFFSTIRYLRHKPYVIGSLVAFFAWLVSHLRPYRIFDESYYKFMKTDLNQIIIYGLKNFWKENVLGRMIY